MSLALDVARARAPAGDDSSREEYLQALRLIERLHRLLLDVIKDEYDRLGGAELNSVQALLLYNMGDSELTAGELKTRGLSYQITDPHVAPANARVLFGADNDLVSWQDAVANADALCFACGHTVYRALDLALLKAKTAAKCLFVDGRHSFSRQSVTAAGFEYIVI